MTITNGNSITITNGTIGSYKELLITSGTGEAAGWIRFYAPNAGANFVVNDVVSGIGIVNGNLVPFSLKVASSMVFTVLLGNNIRLRAIHGR